MQVVKKCSNCYWCQEQEFVSGDGSHMGCYEGGKWRRWIPKKKVDIPNECPNWKDIPIVDI